MPRAIGSNCTAVVSPPQRNCANDKETFVVSATCVRVTSFSTNPGAWRLSPVEGTNGPGRGLTLSAQEPTLPQGRAKAGWLLRPQATPPLPPQRYFPTLILRRSDPPARGVGTGQDRAPASRPLRCSAGRVYSTCNETEPPQFEFSVPTTFPPFLRSPLLPLSPFPPFPLPSGAAARLRPWHQTELHCSACCCGFCCPCSGLLALSV